MDARIDLRGPSRDRSSVYWAALAAGCRGSGGADVAQVVGDVEFAGVAVGKDVAAACGWRLIIRIQDNKNKKQIRGG